MEVQVIQEVIVITMLCLYICKTNGLECFKCTNTKYKSDSEIVKKMFKGVTNKKCDSPSLLDDETTTCDKDEVCGFMEAEIKADIPVVGKLKLALQKRDCMKPPHKISVPECYDEDDYISKSVDDALSSALSLVNSKVEGEVCFCTTDRCSAGGCGKGKVGVLGFCMEWYYWLVAALGIVLIITLLICCCYCCCCRRKRGAGFHVVSH